MMKMNYKGWGTSLLAGIALLCACSDNALVEGSGSAQKEKESAYVATIVAELKDETSKSRLSYHLMDNGSIKTQWVKEDMLAVTPAPWYNEDYFYPFYLTEGEGTGKGTFTCTTAIDGFLPQEYETTDWSVYYPGSKIRNEYDYLTWSYEGQVQHGNDNMEHLVDKHSMFISYFTNPDESPFDEAMLDLSAEGVRQSMCMKFNLSGFPEKVIPTELELRYYDSQDRNTSLFYVNNYVYETYSGLSAKKTYRLTLGLEGFEPTNSVTAYMMMSNGTLAVEQDAKFRVYVKSDDGPRYYADVKIKEDVEMTGGNLYSITCDSWEIEENVGIDVFDNPKDGVTILQEATIGHGTDLIIMGDGFNKDNFEAGGKYEVVMKQAYENFFSVEPHKTLKNHFNVYYVNAVSKDNHDAVPYWTGNGATQGNAVTVFNTKFQEDDTIIEGDTDKAIEYARQALLTKGGKNGTPIDDENELNRRLETSTILVMINVPCGAGTCYIYYFEDANSDYGYGSSVSFSTLGLDDYDCKWTTIHESGGHGFGRLADEYTMEDFDDFEYGIESYWNDLAYWHNIGNARNVAEYWNNATYTGMTKEDTSADNVYWAKLMNPDYGYVGELDESGKGEGLGFYEGAWCWTDYFCRPTENSVMNTHFDENGNFFNAISRWAIWYRLMRLTTDTGYASFEESLDDFMTFDQQLTIPKNIDFWDSAYSRSVLDMRKLRKPSAQPKKIKAEWIDGRLVGKPN